MVPGLVAPNLTALTGGHFVVLEEDWPSYFQVRAADHRAGRHSALNEMVSEGQLGALALEGDYRAETQAELPWG